MRDLAPQITRQRLLIEGIYSNEVDQSAVESFLLGLASHLGLRAYGSPIVHAPSGQGKEANEGFDAFIPLIDSGISLYVWSSAKFFACVIFTCKNFSEDQAVQYTHDYFESSQIEFRSF